MKKLIALLLAVVMVLSMAACAGKKADPTEPPAATPDQATEGTTEEATPFVPELGEGVASKVTYTASDEEVLANREVVVATVGDRELTLAQLQIYYWMSVYGFLNDYGAYATMIGIDPSKGLDIQQCPETGGTWQQYFLQMALDTWHSYQTLVLQAEAEKTPMDPAFQTELDNLETSLTNAATESGYASVEEMLQKDIGPGITFEDYLAYLTVYYTGYSHYNYRCDAIKIDDAAIEAYFNANAEALAEQGITKEEGKVVDVRHILVSVEGGTQDEQGNTTYSDAEWETCQKDAQAILDQWLSGGATEESFAQLAGICTDDPGSKETGGLYENVKTGDMVEEFDAWCFDPVRKVGDYGLVKTSYGYHVMYYSGDEALWINHCRDAAMNEKIGEFVTAAAEAYELKADYDKILLGAVDLAS